MLLDQSRKILPEGLEEDFIRSVSGMLNAITAQELREKFEELKPRVDELRRFL